MNSPRPAVSIAEPRSPAAPGPGGFPEPSARLRPHRRGRRARRLVALALALVLAAGAGAAWVLLKPAPLHGSWVTAERACFTPTIRELGVVVARNETMVLSGFTGEVVWMIDEGTFVEPGAVIVRLDATAANDELERLRKDLFDKEEAVRSAERSLADVTRTGELEVQRLTTALEVAKLGRRDVLEHPLPDERREAELTLESARLSFEKANRDYEAYQDLCQRGFASAAVVKQKRLEMVMAKVEHAKAKNLRDLALQGATSDARRVADLAVADAQKSLATGSFNRDADRAIAQAALELAQIELANFKRNMDEKAREAQDADVKAPVRGRVAFVDVWKGSRGNQSPIQIGESRARGQELCKIADVSALRVKTRCSEVDVKKLQKGQGAEVRLPALPGRVFKARVADLSRVSQDKNVVLSSLALRNAGQAFVNVVEVLADFEDLTAADRERLRLGLTAEVAIACGDATESVLVPWSAVTVDRDGAASVEVPGTFRDPVRRAVKLGRGDALRVEVVEGLTAGDEVLDHGRRATPPGAPLPATAPGSVPR